MHWRRISNERCASFVVDLHSYCEQICQDNVAPRQYGSYSNLSLKPLSSIWLPQASNSGSVSRQDSHDGQKLQYDLFERSVPSVYPGDILGDTSSGVSTIKSDWACTEGTQGYNTKTDSLDHTGSSDKSDTGFQEGSFDRTEDTDSDSLVTENTSYISATPTRSTICVPDGRSSTNGSLRDDGIACVDLTYCEQMDELPFDGNSANTSSLLNEGSKYSFLSSSTDGSSSGVQVDNDRNRCDVQVCARDRSRTSASQLSIENTEHQTVPPLFLSTHHDLVQGNITLIRDRQPSSEPRRCNSLPNIHVCLSKEIKQIRRRTLLKRNCKNRMYKSSFELQVRSPGKYIWRGYVKQHSDKPRILSYRLKCKMNTPDPLNYQDVQTRYEDNNDSGTRRERRIALGPDIQQDARGVRPIDASSLSSGLGSNPVPTGNRLHIPNPLNSVNHRFHSTLQCPCFLFVCFLCCYPAVFLMQKSDAQFISGEDDLARKSARWATRLYITGAVCAVLFLSVVLFFMCYSFG